MKSPRRSPLYGPLRNRRDLALRLLFAAFGIGVVALFWPFAEAVVFATVVAVITWPLFVRVKRLLGGHTIVAAVLMVVFDLIAVAAPIALLVLLALPAANRLLQELASFLESERPEQMLAEAADRQRSLTDGTVFEQIDIVTIVSDNATAAVLETTRTLQNWLPTAVTTTVAVALDLLIFVMLLATLYTSGRHLTHFLRHISPLSPDVDNRLYRVFRRYCRNVLGATFVCAVVQGALAGLGYWIFGVDEPAMLGILTGLGAFVPILGTAFMWVPVCIMVAVQQNMATALLVLAWSIGVTASGDNIVRPLVVRGTSRISPVLIFLAVFGGLGLMGLPGLLLGPILVAWFLALYHILVEEGSLGPVIVEPTQTQTGGFHAAHRDDAVLRPGDGRNGDPVGLRE